jgi:hypothetical protein
VFSLGLVLFQMATGRRAFAGSTAAVVAAAILHEQPPAPSTLRAELPARFDEIVLKALERPNVAVRAGGRSRHRCAAVEAGWRERGDERGRSSSTPSPRRSSWLAAGAFATIAAVSAVAWYAMSSRPATLTPAIARDICERMGGGAVVDGSIAPLGTQYVLGVRATGCQSGDVLGAVQEQIAAKERVLSGLSDIACRLRVRLGESLSTLDEHNRPLPDFTTTSLRRSSPASAACIRPTCAVRRIWL